ncbi:MAG: GFA family protein, partial [Parvularculaceae bacterium]
MTNIRGKCMCGAVAYEATRLSDKIDACHCEACRRWSGHFWASVNAKFSELKFLRGEDRVRWYESSEIVRRGFCDGCGSTLFWHSHRHPDYSDLVGISAGSLDAPTGVKLSVHIFVGEKGDYYDLNDG